VSFKGQQKDKKDKIFGGVGGGNIYIYMKFIFYIIKNSADMWKSVLGVL
jgi:hypothetical protein